MTSELAEVGKLKSGLVQSCRAAPAGEPRQFQTEKHAHIESRSIKVSFMSAVSQSKNVSVNCTVSVSWVRCWEKSGEKMEPYSTAE